MFQTNRFKTGDIAISVAEWWQGSQSNGVSASYVFPYSNYLVTKKIANMSNLAAKRNSNGMWGGIQPAGL